MMTYIPFLFFSSGWGLSFAVFVLLRSPFKACVWEGKPALNARSHENTQIQQLKTPFRQNFLHRFLPDAGSLVIMYGLSDPLQHLN
jgi:hypothetical protein